MKAFPQYDEYLGYIASKDTAAAFVHLVEASIRIPGYDFMPKSHGYIERSCHYYSNGVSLFAFVVNKSSLLWYFRNPERTHPSLSLAELAATFPKVNQRKDGQVTARLITADDAAAVLRLSFPWLTTQARQI